MAATLRFIFAFLFIGHISIAQAQTSRFVVQKFSADTIKTSIDELVKELRIKHPGFYRYNSKEKFTQFIDSVKNTITDSLTEMEAYLKFKPIISNIHCLHTGLSLPNEYKDFLNQQPDLFPFQVYFNDHRLYVVKNYSTVNSISEGDEILSINGKSIDSIVGRLLLLIPSDGYNLTMKYRALYLQFPTWYRSIDLSENFETVIRRNNSEKTYQVKGAKFKDIVRDGF